MQVSPLIGFALEMSSVAFLKLVAGCYHGGRRFWRIFNGVVSVVIIIFGRKLGIRIVKIRPYYMTLAIITNVLV